MPCYIMKLKKISDFNPEFCKYKYIYTICDEHCNCRDNHCRGEL